MYHCTTFQIGEVKIPLCMVDLAQTIEEWKDIQSVKVDDQVSALFSYPETTYAFVTHYFVC